MIQPFLKFLSEGVVRELNQTPGHWVKNFDREELRLQLSVLLDQVLDQTEELLQQHVDGVDVFFSLWVAHPALHQFCLLQHPGQDQTGFPEYRLLTDVTFALKIITVRLAESLQANQYDFYEIGKTVQVKNQLAIALCYFDEDFQEVNHAVLHDKLLEPVCFDKLLLSELIDDHQTVKQFSVAFQRKSDFAPIAKKFL